MKLKDVVKIYQINKFAWINFSFVWLSHF